LRETQSSISIPTASKILYDLIGNDEGLRELVRQETLNSEIGAMVYRARKAAKLTQTELARRIGTTQAVISRLESANYEGYSLGMLQRVAEALGQKLELRFSSAA
jgi:ribosome-binding protein aMBF1 (putative translation factor)